MAWDRELVIRQELQDGERLVWSGMPGRLAMLLRAVVPMMMGAAFMAVPLGQLRGAWTDPTVGEGRLFITVFLAIFVVVGFGLAAGAVAGVFSSNRTAYAVTDRRVLIIRDMFGRKIVDYGPRDIGAVVRKERSDGTGHVEFRQEVTGTGDDRRTNQVGFYGVRDVRGAAAAIERLRQGAPTLPSSTGR